MLNRVSRALWALSWIGAFVVGGFYYLAVRSPVYPAPPDKALEGSLIIGGVIVGIGWLVRYILVGRA